MTYKEAAQSALDVQNACNASGVIKSLAQCTEIIWSESNKLNLGSRWVNRHPIIALYLFKIGELNGFGISSLDAGYDIAYKLCKNIVAGNPEPDYHKAESLADYHFLQW